ncbi:putative bifunctional diguanylate cyclase/phosphodiesterase [Pseudidiomarina sp.]|uniref:putative bifunctional diguanylate cyclase/phosphodiesterase n=1 Tax=Pseudidiomarina sp. TaxID=2081707 RepID=UPI003A981446
MHNMRSLIFTAIFGLGLTALAAVLLEQYDHRRVDERMQSDAQSLQSNVRGSLIRLLYAGELASDLLQVSEREPAAQLPMLKQAMSTFYQSVRQIVVLDENFNLLDQELLTGNELLNVARYQGTSPQLAKLNELTRGTALVNAMNLSLHSHDLALFIPVTSAEQRYFIALVIDVKELLKQSIHHHIIEGYQVEVRQNNTLIYVFSGESDLKHEWSAEFTIRAADNNWQFYLWPTAEKFSQLHLVNSYVVPLIGMFMTGFLMLLVFRMNTYEQTIKSIQHDKNEFGAQLKKRDEVEKQLAFLSEHDALTEVPNRNALLRYLHETLPKLATEKGQLVAIQLNVDHFKDINNALGHKIGDELLRRLAHRLQRCVVNFDFIARIGGDEFLVIKQGVTTDEQAMEIAEQLVRIVKPEFYINSHEVYASASMGIAFANDADFDADNLLRHTDAALNQAKKFDYHGINIYTRTQQSELSKRQFVLEQLHKAVETNRVEVHYQPVFDLRTQTITGFEALMRWRQDDGELALPDQFLPLIEDTGLIVPLTDNLLKRVLTDYRAWLKDGNTELTIGINLSGKQLALPELPELLANNLRRNQVPPENLQIEIREELYCSHACQPDGILAKLKELGVKLTVDGMGLNYKTIKAMQHCPPYLLKISQPLMSDIPHNKIQALIAETMIKFGHERGIQISAVGVETQQQVDFLLQRDCLSAQGYYLARPVPADQVPAMLANPTIPNNYVPYQE